MYGFRPARNRQHPGDPPPKWAPLGRLGRVVILLTVVIGVVIAMLVLATRPADALDDAPAPQPPPWFGGRVEMPEQGFAVTLPDGWVAFDFTGDVDEQVALVVRHIRQQWEACDSTFCRSLVNVLTPTMLEARIANDLEGYQDTYVLVASDLSWVDSAQGIDGHGETGECGLKAEVPWAALAPDERADHFDDLVVSVAALPRWDVVGTWRESSIGGRPAFAVDTIDTEAAPGSKQFREYTSYFIERDDHLRPLVCRGSSSPDDRWLSIAETFEFLPAAEIDG